MKIKGRTILIFGATGLLGRNLVSELYQYGSYKVVGLGSSDIDLIDREQIWEIIGDIQPALVINCAAITDVDRCERETDRAYAINSAAPAVMASVCKRFKASMMQISTNYVFSGYKNRPYTQNDTPEPVSIYGRTKFLAEQQVRSTLGSSFIIRTSMLFGEGGKNFISKLVSSISEGNIPAQIDAIIDQELSPTYAPDLAKYIIKVIESGRFGLYHITNRYSTTPYDMAKLVLDQLGLKVSLGATTWSRIKSLAPRPKYSVMECLNLGKAGIPAMRSWQDALSEFVNLQQALTKAQP